MEPPIFNLYTHLRSRLGPQGWWPVNRRADIPRRNDGVPLDGIARWEIMVGAVLTQNTAWRNVERALDNLRSLQSSGEGRIPGPDRFTALAGETLAERIYPAGYYNQKAKKLRILAEAVTTRDWQPWGARVPRRDEILSLWGIGDETADCMMVYAFGVPHMVVDQYKRRILARIAGNPGSGFPRLGGDFTASEQMPYAELAGMLEDQLPRDVRVYNEFHALLVRLGSLACGKRAVCASCPLGPSGSGMCRGV